MTSSHTPIYTHITPHGFINPNSFSYTKKPTENSILMKLKLNEKLELSNLETKQEWYNFDTYRPFEPKYKWIFTDVTSTKLDSLHLTHVSIRNLSDILPFLLKDKKITILEKPEIYDKYNPEYKFYDKYNIYEYGENEIYIPKFNKIGLYVKNPHSYDISIAFQSSKKSSGGTNKFTIKELKEQCKKRNICIKGLTKKADIINAMKLKK